MIYRKVYLDNNATTKIDQRVKESMLELADFPLNPSSVHGYGREARRIIEDARKKIVDSLYITNKKLFKIIFTSCGTESNNLAMNGLRGYKKLISPIEHLSILNILTTDYNTSLKVDQYGIIQLDDLEIKLSSIDGPKLVSVMIANNETGVIQNIKNITEIAKKYNAVVHSDASQYYGRLKLNIEDLGLDMITLAAHKIGGPYGVSALVIKKNLPLLAQLIGGGQEEGYRAGTENVMAIHGFGVVAEYVEEKLEKYNKIKDLRDLLEASIKQACNEALIFCDKLDRLPNTTLIFMPNVTSETQLINFDTAGIFVSAGSACSSGKIKPSHVLKAMGVKDDVAKCTVRVSLGIDNTKEEVEYFVKTWCDIYNRINKKGC